MTAAQMPGTSGEEANITFHLKTKMGREICAEYRLHGNEISCAEDISTVISSPNRHNDVSAFFLSDTSLCLFGDDMCHIVYKRIFTSHSNLSFKAVIDKLPFFPLSLFFLSLFLSQDIILKFTYAQKMLYLMIMYIAYR